MTVWLLYRSFRLSGAAGLSQSRRQRLMESYGLLLGVMALFAHASVNFIFYVLPLSLLAGLFLAQAYRQCVTASDRFFTLPVRASISRVGLVSMLALPIAALLIDGITATVFLLQPPAVVRHILAPDTQTAYNLARTMSALRPGNLVPALYLAGINRQLSVAAEGPADIEIFARRARDNYIKALAITEHNAYALTEFAQLLKAHPDLQSGLQSPLSTNPEDLLRQAIRVEPAYEPAYLALAKLLEEQGNPESAHALLTEEAMLWFTLKTGSQHRRIQIVEHALDLALRLGNTESARVLAMSMLANVPDHARAQETLRSIDPDVGSSQFNID